MFTISSVRFTIDGNHILQLIWHFCVESSMIAHMKGVNEVLLGYRCVGVMLTTGSAHAPRQNWATGLD